VDDPIFDPWFVVDPPSLGEPEPRPAVPPTGSEQPASPARWSRAASERAPVARTRSRPARRSDQPTVPEATLPPRPTLPPASAPVAKSRVPSPHRRFLQDLLLPRLESLSARLELAGHAATTDERLTAMPPSVRFRLTPRPGGFDDAPESVAAVLEVLLDDAGSRVAGRVWLDPQSDRPTSEVTATVLQADLAWLDRLLVDFVEKTLGRV